MRLFTIGYGGRRPGEFVELLQEHGIKLLVDVRGRPDRAHLGSFVKAKAPDKGIEKLLASGGIEYMSIPELGNPFYHEDNWVEHYQKLFTKVGKEQIPRLLKLKKRFALMCAEKHVKDCHRQYIAAELERRGCKVVHIE